MFDKLSARLASVVEGLRGRGRLTEENIADTLRQVPMALLEADVALPVVREFVARIKEAALGQEVRVRGQPFEVIGVAERMGSVLGLENGARLIMVAFAGTGAIFLGMASLSSIIKRDLTSMGKWLFIGAIMLLVIWLRVMKGHFTPPPHFAFEGVAWYWHFVDVVWLGLFVFVYWL